MTRLSHTTSVEVQQCDGEDKDFTMFTIEQETGCGDTQELTLTSDEMDALMNVAAETFSAEDYYVPHPDELESVPVDERPDVEGERFP